MACSKEEIEKKRLAALQKRQSKSAEICAGNRANLPSVSQAGPAKSAFGSPRSFHPYATSNGSKEKSSVPVDKVISGTVYLISENRFEVKPSEFCTALINIFKTIPSRNYDANSKLWNFSIDDYEVLMSKVTPLAPHVVLGPIPPYVLKILREKLMEPSNVDLTPVEPTLRQKLLPFQEDGVRYAISRGGRCMIADDMGLGKTYQALAVASYYRNDWPLLIVTTSSMRDIWQSSLHELLPSVPLMNIVTLSNGRDAQLVADKQTEVVIVSFKITTMHADLLKNKNFGFVIIDESHNLKSHKAQCTVAITAATRRGRRAVLLSGTPAMSRPAELFSQLALIQPTLLPNYVEYGKRYCNGKQSTFGWDMSGQSNLPELQIVLQKRFLIRRTKEQVLTLEEKTRETVLLDQSLLASSREQLSEASSAYARTAAADRHAALLTYFSVTARIKIPAVCKYVSQIISEEKEKFLIFAHHKCMVDAICSTLDEAAVSYICIVGATPGHARAFLIFAHHKCMVDAVCSTLDEAAVSYICIVGATPGHARAELVEKFQHGSCRAGVLSLTAAGAGLTLTAAALVVFAELHWNPGILIQAESRAHRLGRAGGVRARYLLAPDTADLAVWPILRAKLSVLNDVGLSRDSFEDTTLKHQETQNSMTQYLTPSKVFKNKNDYIPGTNIRKDQKNDDKQSNSSSSLLNDSQNSANLRIESVLSDSISDIQNTLDSDIKSEFLEKSFMEIDEDDELLANLDL